MFPSFQPERLIRCLGTPTVHHEGVCCFLCIHFQIYLLTSDYNTSVFFFTQMYCNAIHQNSKYFERPHPITLCYLHVYYKVHNTVCKRSVWSSVGLIGKRWHHSSKVSTNRNTTEGKTLAPLRKPTAQAQLQPRSPPLGHTVSQHPHS